MAFRDPLREAALGWDQLIQGLVMGQQTNLAQRNRKEDIDREQARYEAENARLQDAEARRIAEQRIMQAQEIIGRLRSQPASPDRDRALQVASQVVRSAEGVLASPQGQAWQAYQAATQEGIRSPEQQAAAPASPRERAAGRAAMPGVPVVSALGEAAGVAAAGALSQQQLEEVRRANSAQLNSIYNDLRTGINPTDPGSLVAVRSALEAALSLQGSPVLAGDDRRLADLPRFAEAILRNLADDPSTSEIRELAMRLMRAQATTAEAGVRTAQAQAEIAQYGIRSAELANIAAEGNLDLAAIERDLAQQALTAATDANVDRRAANAWEAIDRWEATGLIEDRYREEAKRRLGRGRTLTDEEFNAMSDERFERYRSRVQAEDDLLRLAVDQAESNLNLSNLEIDVREYNFNRQQNVLDALADAENGAALVTQAFLNGDAQRLGELLYELESNPDGTIGRALAASGITAESLRTRLTRAATNQVYQDRARELAMDEADLALANARRTGMIVAADTRQRIAATMPPDQIDAWWASLSAQDRELLGGEYVLAGIKRDAQVANFLAGEPVRAHAYNQVAAIMGTIPEDDARALAAANTIYTLLLEATDDPTFAEAMANGALGNWKRGDAAWQMELQKHELWSELTRAQIGELNASIAAKQAAGQDPSIDIKTLLDVYNTERQVADSNRNTLLERMTNMECIVVQSPDALLGGRRYTEPGAGMREGHANYDACRGMSTDLERLDYRLRNIATEIDVLLQRPGAGTPGATGGTTGTAGGAGGGPYSPGNGGTTGAGGGGAPAGGTAAPAASTAPRVAGAEDLIGSAPPIADVNDIVAPPQAEPDNALAAELGLSRPVIIQLADALRDGETDEEGMRRDLATAGFTEDQIERLIAEVKRTLGMYGASVATETYDPNVVTGGGWLDDAVRALMSGPASNRAAWERAVQYLREYNIPTGLAPSVAAERLRAAVSSAERASGNSLRRYAPDR